MVRSRKLVVLEYRLVYIAGGDVMRGLRINWDLGLFTLVLFQYPFLVVIV